MSILIVDDVPNTRHLLKTILEAAGFTELVTAESATEAFQHLGVDEPAGGGQEIDLVLMDIIMPRIDGVEACRLIKAREHLRDIPIIVVTAKTQVDDLLEAFEAGAMDFIVKPPNPIELVARVRSALRLKQEMDSRKARERELEEAKRQLEREKQTLRRLSSLDGLTGIANRRHFDQSLDLEWRRAIRDAKPLSLIMVDIDYFKPYNDTCGHQRGDDCLKRVASVISNALRRPGDLVARYGGEEFAVLLPGTDAAGAVFVAETLREKVEALAMPHASSSVSQRVTISLGVATSFPQRDVSAADLIAAADKALYQAKQEGRNRVKVSETSS